MSNYPETRVSREQTKEGVEEGAEQSKTLRCVEATIWIVML